MEKSCWWKLPGDIQAEILSRLKGRILIRLKLVSWEWYNVISYICMPRLAAPSPGSSLFGFVFRDCQYKGVGPPSDRARLAITEETSNFKVPCFLISDRLEDNYQPDDIQDCCNGLLLALHHGNDDRFHYSVHNPTTGETIHVPEPPGTYHIRTTQCCFASLAFEPTKSHHYKIICTPGGSITNPLKVEMFSSQTGKWLTHVANVDSKLDGVDWIYRSAYLNGHFYRLLKTNYIACICEGKSSHLSVQAIELPNFRGDTICMNENNCYGSIGVSIKRLHFSTRYRDGSTLLVYMLKDDFSWVLKYTISIDDLLPCPSSPFAKLLKRVVNTYRKEAWFYFYAFHPSCDLLYIITPCYILNCSPKEKFVELCHFQGGERPIVVGKNYGFPCSHCPIILQSAFQRISCANLDLQFSACSVTDCRI